jgi:hypothetical protein
MLDVVVGPRLGAPEVPAERGEHLLALRAAYSADPGRPGWYIGQCQLPAIDGTGSHLLVSCDRFGRLDRARFTALPGSAPKPQSRPPGNRAGSAPCRLLTAHSHVADERTG